MPTIAQDIHKPLVADYCVKYIEKNGYIRTGWAAKMALGENELTFENDAHKFAFLNSVSSLVIKSGKYLRHPLERSGKVYDYDLVDNPNYELNETTKKSNIATEVLNNEVLPRSINTQRIQTNWSIVLAGLSVIFIGISAYLQFSDPLPKKVEQVEKAIQELSKKVQQLEISPKVVNSSIRVSVDSLPSK